VIQVGFKAGSERVSELWITRMMSQQNRTVTGAVKGESEIESCYEVHGE